MISVFPGRPSAPVRGPDPPAIVRPRCGRQKLGAGSCHRPSNRAAGSEPRVEPSKGCLERVQSGPDPVDQMGAPFARPDPIAFEPRRIRGSHAPFRSRIQRESGLAVAHPAALHVNSLPSKIGPHAAVPEPPACPPLRRRAPSPPPSTPPTTTISSSLPPGRSKAFYIFVLALMVFVLIIFSIGDLAQYVLGGGWCRPGCHRRDLDGPGQQEDARGQRQGLPRSQARPRVLHRPEHLDRAVGVRRERRPDPPRRDRDRGRRPVAHPRADGDRDRHRDLEQGVRRSSEPVRDRRRPREHRSPRSPQQGHDRRGHQARDARVQPASFDLGSRQHVRRHHGRRSRLERGQPRIPLRVHRDQDLGLGRGRQGIGTARRRPAGLVRRTPGVPEAPVLQRRDDAGRARVRADACRSGFDLRRDRVVGQVPEAGHGRPGRQSGALLQTSRVPRDS